MKVVMLKTSLGSENGRNTTIFKKDHLYDICENLAKSFISLGVAKLFSVDGGEKMQSAPLNKALTAKQYQNKSKGK